MRLTLGLAGWMTEEGFAAKDEPGRLGLAINQKGKNLRHIFCTSHA
jgi:hypothetical protein